MTSAHFNVSLDTWKEARRLQGIQLASEHSREMLCEALRKIDRLLETDRTRHHKIAGRRRYERYRW